MRIFLVLTLLGCVALSQSKDCTLQFKIDQNEIDNKLCTVTAADTAAIAAVKKDLDDVKTDMEKTEKDMKTFSTKMQSDILTEQVQRVNVQGQILLLKQKLAEAQKKNDELKKLVESRESDLKSAQADLVKATETYNWAARMLKGKTIRSSEIHLALDPAEWDPFSTDDPDFFQAPVDAAELEGEGGAEEEEGGETDEGSDEDGDEVLPGSDEDADEVLHALEKFLEDHDI
ncbi:Hypp9287 [Branchiostoma lanceolatum]|uniref:Hypp9287 protein n=1 Tax=Branchiostoma lanceolatum TaxID=7740 RepID=A0A8K0EIL3_BRALA|nr:Hypp9287 [Branchiostoma lanceolatum]